MKVIVLAAGAVDHNQLFVSDLESPLLIPFNGQPLLNSMIIGFQKIPISQVYFAVPEEAHRTRALLEMQAELTPFTISVTLIKKSDKSSYMETLRLTLAEIEQTTDETLLLLHGDGLYEFSSKSFSNKSAASVFIDQHPNFSNRYSRVGTDAKSIVTKFYKKTDPIEIGETAYTETGAYIFPSLNEIKAIFTDSQVISTPADIFQLLNGSVEGVLLESWKDFGHWDLISSHNNFNSPRVFNKVELMDSGQLVRKSSRDTSKLSSEFRYLNAVPATLEQYFPRTLGKGEDYYEIEYWPLKTLSEYYVYWGLPRDVWQRAARSLTTILHKFALIPAPKKALGEFCATKLLERHSDFPSQINRILDNSIITINQQDYVINPDYIKRFSQQLSAIKDPLTGSFVHGDFCFSNILFSPESGLLKFIDPRGFSGKEPDVTSIIYDLAKLLHSCHGLYDFIVQDFFKIHCETEGVYTFEIFLSQDAASLSNIFLDEISRGYPDIPLSDIFAIEASLFFSMIPLHSESPLRQLAFLLRGIQIASLSR